MKTTAAEKEREFEKYLFRRQFLISEKELNSPTKYFKCHRFDKYFLYSHFELEINICHKNKESTVLIGYAIDSRAPHKSNIQITEFLAETCTKVSDFSEPLFNLAGRFVLLAIREEQLYVFHDACGLRQFFYQVEDNFAAASSVPLLGCAANLVFGKKYTEYIKSKYAKTKKEHWIPSGISLLENVKHLVPNHFLVASSGEQVRFFPDRDFLKINDAEAAKESATIIKNLILGASERFNLALPLTAGLDSRILISALKDVPKKIFYYTLQYRKLNFMSPDIYIPKYICKFLKVSHKIIKQNKKLSPWFLETFKANNIPHHINDYAFICNGMLEKYPENYVCLKGNCNEITRVFYKPSDITEQSLTFNDLIKREKYWAQFSFIREHTRDWFNELIE